MLKYVICLLALVGCGLPEKNHCTTAADCLEDEACHDGTCQPTSHDACGPTRAACAADATCSDAQDALACTCNEGFSGDGLSCDDVDECAAAASPCSVHATCSNLPGSFACACSAGFTGDATASYCVPMRFKKIAAAGGFTCGLAEDGGIYCWGLNADGDVGDGTSLPRARPTQVGTATDWIDVDAHTIVGCGIRADHSMWCWGFGTNGQIGDGQSKDQYTPTKVVSDKPGIGWKAMALGRQGVCALHDDGSVACWGYDYVTGAIVTVPTAVDANTDWTDISVGTVLCGIRGTPGQLYCWGKSRNGDLGLGDTESQATPAQVGTDTWRSVHVGYYNTCGIRSDGSLMCWGDSPLTTSALQYGHVPQQVGTATDWQTVSLSSGGVIGLRAGGLAYVWGANDLGQLGVPLAREIVDATPISGPITGWSDIRSGNTHGCGIAAGQAYCWGSVSTGLLGEGTSTTLYSPTKIGADRWTAVAGGPGTCGLRADGALMCWGYDIDRGIGFGNTEPVWAPTRVAPRRGRQRILRQRDDVRHQDRSHAVVLGPGWRPGAHRTARAHPGGKRIILGQREPGQRRQLEPDRVCDQAEWHAVVLGRSAGRRDDGLVGLAGPGRHRQHLEDGDGRERDLRDPGGRHAVVLGQQRAARRWRGRELRPVAHRDRHPDADRYAVGLEHGHDRLAQGRDVVRHQDRWLAVVLGVRRGADPRPRDDARAGSLSAAPATARSRTVRGRRRARSRRPRG